MTNDAELSKFIRFRELVLSGVDYEDAIKETEGLSDDYVLDDASRELFDALFKTEALLDHLATIPEEQRPTEELNMMREALEGFIDEIQERD